MSKWEGGTEMLDLERDDCPQCKECGGMSTGKSFDEDTDTTFTLLVLDEDFLLAVEQIIGCVRDF